MIEPADFVDVALDGRSLAFVEALLVGNPYLAEVFELKDHKFSGKRNVLTIHADYAGGAALFLVEAFFSLHHCAKCDLSAMSRLDSRNFPAFIAALQAWKGAF